MNTINQKILALLLIMSSSFFAISQNIEKSLLCKNWMIKVIKTSNDLEEPSLRNPKTNLTLETNGNFDWSYKSDYKGTWRIEKDFLFLFFKNENALHPYKSITQCYKIIDVNKSSLKLNAFSPTQLTDIFIEFVPFN